MYIAVLTTTNNREQSYKPYLLIFLYNLGKNTGCPKKMVIQLWHACHCMCVNCWVYERNFCMAIKSKVLAVEWQVSCATLSKTEQV